MMYQLDIAPGTERWLGYAKVLLRFMVRTIERTGVDSLYKKTKTRDGTEITVRANKTGLNKIRLTGGAIHPNIWQHTTIGDQIIPYTSFATKLPKVSFSSEVLTEEAAVATAIGSTSVSLATTSASSTPAARYTQLLAQVRLGQSYVLEKSVNYLMYKGAMPLTLGSGVEGDGDYTAYTLATPIETDTRRVLFKLSTDESTVYMGIGPYYMTGATLTASVDQFYVYDLSVLSTLAQRDSDNASSHSTFAFTTDTIEVEVTEFGETFTLTATFAEDAAQPSSIIDDQTQSDINVRGVFVYSNNVITFAYTVKYNTHRVFDASTALVTKATVRAGGYTQVNKKYDALWGFTYSYVGASGSIDDSTVAYPVVDGTNVGSYDSTSATTGGGQIELTGTGGVTNTDLTASAGVFQTVTTGVYTLNIPYLAGKFKNSDPDADLTETKTWSMASGVPLNPSVPRNGAMVAHVSPMAVPALKFEAQTITVPVANDAALAPYAISTAGPTDKVNALDVGSVTTTGASPRENLYLSAQSDPDNAVQLSFTKYNSRADALFKGKNGLDIELEGTRIRFNGAQSGMLSFTSAASEATTGGFLDLVSSKKNVLAHTETYTQTTTTDTEKDVITIDTAANQVEVFARAGIFASETFTFTGPGNMGEVKLYFEGGDRGASASGTFGFLLNPGDHTKVISAVFSTWALSADQLTLTVTINHANVLSFSTSSDSFIEIDGTFTQVSTVQSHADYAGAEFTDFSFPLTAPTSVIASPTIWSKEPHMLAGNTMTIHWPGMTETEDGYCVLEHTGTTYVLAWNDYEDAVRDGDTEAQATALATMRANRTILANNFATNEFLDVLDVSNISYYVVTT